MSIRPPTGFVVFENCFKFLQKTWDETKWLAFEIANDARLKKKATGNGFTYRLDCGQDKVEARWTCIEIPKQHHSLWLITHPGYSQKKALNKTTFLHEVCSIATAVSMVAPLCEWAVKVSNIMCKCLHCVVNYVNDICIYSPWYKARIDSMIEKGRRRRARIRQVHSISS